MSVISGPEEHEGQNTFLMFVVGGALIVGAAIMANGGQEDGSNSTPQSQASQEQTEAPQNEPAHKSGRPWCTEVDSRAGVKVFPGDSVFRIAEQEMPEITNTNKAAAMILEMNNRSDSTIHPDEILKIPAEACVIHNK
jgi:hypothetical protein